MSRLGKIPIKIPAGVEAAIKDGFIVVKGTKAELKQKLHPLVKVEVDDKEKEIRVSVKNKEAKKEKAFWGLYWSLIGNMVAGADKGFQKGLEVSGVGFRVALSGRKITLHLGFSHPVEYDLPDGIDAKVEGNVITLSGADKQLVGETAARIRKLRKPDPYKAKGIKYVGEIIRRKEGKTAVKGE